MRSDLSKSLKLNCGESGCLEGGIQSGASRQCCRVNAGGDTATQERKKEEEKENREQQRLIRPFLKKREVGNSIRAAETNEQSVINSARRLGLVALHQQRTLSSHVRQSELCRRRLEREREMLTAGRPTTASPENTHPQRTGVPLQNARHHSQRSLIRTLQTASSENKSRRDVWKTSPRTILTTINPSCNE